jgi:hypothetical protein
MFQLWQLDKLPDRVSTQVRARSSGSILLRGRPRADVQRNSLSSLSARLPCLLAVALGLFVSAPAWARGVAVGDATAKQRSDVERKLSEGKKLVAKGKFEEAIALFRAAHDIVQSPEATLFIARARRDTGELVAAHADYLTALEEAETAAKTETKYESTLTAVRKDLEDLEGVLGKLVIKLVYAPEGTEVTVDGQPIDAAKLASPLLVAPGTMDVVATAPDGDVSRRQATVNAGQSATVELAFQRKGEPAKFFAGEPGEDGEAEGNETAKPSDKAGTGGGSNTLAYVAGGVGVAGIATFAILGSMANGKFDDLEKACPEDRCPPERQGDIDDGKQLQTFANIGLAVGIVGVGTGAALLLFGGSKGDEANGRPSAELVLGVGSIRVRGKF